MEEQKLKINIAPEVATGKYSNLAIIGHSNSEFVLDFASNLPGVPQANVVSRVILTPEHAKRLLNALADNVNKYEQQFGKIQLNSKPVPGSTLPLSFGGGEA